MNLYRVLGHFSKDYDFKSGIGLKYVVKNVMACVMASPDVELSDSQKKDIDKHGYTVIKSYDKKEFFDFAFDTEFKGKKDGNYIELLEKVVKQISRNDKLETLKI